MFTVKCFATFWLDWLTPAMPAPLLIRAQCVPKHAHDEQEDHGHAAKKLPNRSGEQTQRRADASFRGGLPFATAHQLEQRRAYGLEILSTPDERRVRELFRASRDPLPKGHK